MGQLNSKEGAVPLKQTEQNLVRTNARGLRPGSRGRGCTKEEQLEWHDREAV